MLKIILQELRKVQFVADWLDFRAAKRDSRKLSARYRKELEEAKKRNADQEEFAGISGQYQCEAEQIWRPIDVQQTNRLIARARKYAIRVPSRPRKYDEDNDDWILSSTNGEWFLSDEAEERIKREIRIERRQSYDEFRKWATVGFAFLAFLLGITSLLKKDKQPDPCPKNYYRNDSGECVFALRAANANAAYPETLAGTRHRAEIVNECKRCSQQIEGQEGHRPSGTLRLAARSRNRRKI